MTKRRALITGITGQDGSYLAELLLQNGYEVHGLVRRVAMEDPAHRLSRLEGILGRIHLHAASMDSFPSLYAALSKIRPDELYHLALATPPPLRKPLLWIRKGTRWRIDWTRMWQAVARNT